MTAGSPRRTGERGTGVAERFALLQGRLGPLLDGPATTVVVPSITLHPDELRKIPGAVHFEERLLFELARLRAPRARVVYVTSRPVDPDTVESALAVTGTTGARDRLTLIDCGDASARPLADKILDRTDVLARITAARGDYLVTYTTTTSERDLSVRLGLPLFGCDPRLRGIGDKSGGRRLLRAAGVPVPDGYEGLASAAAVTDALTGLKHRHRNLERAVVKLNDSFAGAGNAVFSYAGAPAGDGLAGWVADRLPERLAVPGDTWAGFLAKLAEMGGVVERFHTGPAMGSPSVQLEIRPGGDVRMLSTHDQVLGGPAGLTFVGCAFPAHPAYRSRIGRLALRVGDRLAAAGVLGQLSVDFLADRHDPARTYGLEVNLRMGGATAPFLFAHALLRGRYDPATGDYVTAHGPRHYLAGDRILVDRLRGARPGAVLDLVAGRRLAYDPATGTGVVLYALGALAEFGKLGMIAIADSAAAARSLYDRTVTVLAGMP